MKKILLSTITIVAFIVYSLHQKSEDADISAAKGVKSANQPQATNVTTTPQQIYGSASPTAMPTESQITPTPIQKGVYKNGTYTGAVTDAFYGNVQVQINISNGKISNVQFLQYPNDRGTSVEINSQAMPYLKQEAIQAQNAQVDIVSGATQTSLAFRQSLQSAIDQAKS